MRPLLPVQPTESQIARSQNARLLFVWVLVIAVAVAFLPRVILLTVSSTNVGTGSTQKPKNTPTQTEQTQMALLVRASDRLQTGKTGSGDAALLLDSLPDAPLPVNAADNTDAGGKNTPFSSSLLVLRLGRQIDRLVQNAQSPNASPRQKADALCWLNRSRRLADAALAAPSPSLDALKAAHYLDTLIGRRTIALYRAWGDKAATQNAVRQQANLRRVWKEAALPLLTNATVLDLNRQTEADEAAWQAELAQIVALYRASRITMQA